jgi:tRNA pseudouridine32 synthase/23S rRNA pseudouridine746 synthase
MRVEKFHSFKSDISDFELPKQFNYPFHYEADPLCRLAAEELQAYLQKQQEWQHDFDVLGKMFGVMLVENQKGEIGYLAAFSGKLANSNNWSVFVPAIFDMLEEEGFYRRGEEQLNQLNREIEALENSDLRSEQSALVEEEEQLADFCLKREKQRLKRAKKLRKAQRIAAEGHLDAEEYEELLEKLKKESLDQQYHFKRLKNYWQLRLEHKRKTLEGLEDQLVALKQERKAKSGALQQQLFDQYQFLNAEGNLKGVSEIFAQTVLEIPPSGAGECAAPKLLQYAYQHDLKPLAMAEFWWGKSPNSQIRQHGQFYPACKGKCQPILGHMLLGLDVEENPLLQNPAEGKEIEIIYEDTDLLLVHKPEGMLSVPGKHIEDSVYSRIRKRYPEAKGPLVVHRLDMSTSGLLLIALNEETHKDLQHQFIKRKIKKRYLALLEGVVEAKEGTIDLPLKADFNERPRQMVCFEEGKSARTHWKRIAIENNKTRIHFFPVTGRTHQLRVHAAHPLGLGCPIVGDDLYGQRADRLCLHAESIEFRHPHSQELMSFEVGTDF